MLGPATEDEWLAVAAAAPSATFFHTPHWARVAAAAGGWEPAALSGRLGDGARVVYPLVRTPRRRTRRLAAGWSAWAGCYGGPVAERPLRADETAALHRAAARHHPADLRVTLPPATAGLPVPGEWPVVRDATFHVDLTGGEDAIVGRFHEGHRRAFRRGAREGLTARPADDPADAAVYLELYEETLAHWGEAATSRYPPAVFEALSAIAREAPGSARLYLAEHEGRPVAGTWSLAWGGTVILWHAAFRDVRIKMSSPQITLYATVMLDAAARGMHTLDFNPSGGHDGASAFKRRFGAQERPVLRARVGRGWARRALSAINRVHRAAA